MPDDYGVEGIFWLNALIDDERPVYSDDILPPTISQEIMNHIRQMPFLAPDASGKSVQAVPGKRRCTDGKPAQAGPGHGTAAMPSKGIHCGQSEKTRPVVLVSLDWLRLGIRPSG